MLIDIRNQKYCLGEIVECCKKYAVELALSSTLYYSVYKRKAKKEYFNILKKSNK